MTGGGSGIGRVTAQLLADEGAIVRIGDVDEAGMTQTIGDRTSITPAVCNVADEESVHTFVQNALSEYGQVDAVVNLAGVLHFANTHEVTLAQWQRIININLTGTFLLCRETLPSLCESQGAIVNTASTAAHIGQAWSAAYCASKGAIVALTRSLAVEYGRKGVRVNSVSPGGIDTPITAAFAFPEGADKSLLSRTMPLGQMGTPHDVAVAIAYLASDDAKYVNGTDLRVDGATTA